MPPRARPHRAPKRDHAAVLVRQADGSVWRPDAAVTITFSPNYQVTDHPVEDGVTVSDHVQRMPNTIVATVIVTENPTRSGGVVGGRVYVREQLAWLYETANAGQLVNVVTRRLGVFAGYAITGLPHTIDKVARLEFQVTLREVRVATAQAVQVTVEQVTGSDDGTEAGAPDEIDSGEQPTESTEGTEGEDEDKSTLAGLLDAWG